MHKLIWFALVMGLCGSGRPLRADYFCDFISIRAEPELSRIVIRAEEIRGHQPVNQFCARRAQHYRAGRFLMQREKPKLIKMTWTLDRRRVAVEINIYPARGSGRGGANPSATLKLWVDGVRRLDCPLGFDSTSDSTIQSVIVHCADNAVQVLWTGGDTGERWLFPGIDDARFDWNRSEKSFVARPLRSE